MRPLLSSITTLALYACASPSSDGGFEPLWSQRPEERGRLPVGNVTSIERIGHQEPVPLATQASAGSLPGAGVSGNTAGVVAATTGISAALVYRYTLRMVGGASRQVEAEHAFKVGDCVALRNAGSGRASVITALADECR